MPSLYVSPCASSSSHEASWWRRPAMRPIMQLSAVSTPAAIWLCTGPVTMLSMKVRSLSRSAKARLSSKAPLAENLPDEAEVAAAPCQDHLFAPYDLDRARVRNGGRAFGAENAQACFKHSVVAELRGGKREMHVVGIEVVDLVVVPAVAGVGEDVAASGGRGLERARAENPVAQVDDVNVLLDQNVSGERAVPEPVAEAVLVGGGAALSFFRAMRARSSIRVTEAILPERAGFDFFRNGGDGRRTAALEAHIDTLRGADALWQFREPA